MSAMIQEKTLGRVRDYQDKNISNNGQLVYTPCQQSNAMKHGELYFENITHADEKFDQKQQVEGKVFNADLINSGLKIAPLQSEKGEIENEKIDDDVEIVFFKDNITGALLIEIVQGKDFLLGKNVDKQCLAASFDVGMSNGVSEKAFPSVDELVAASELIAKETKTPAENGDTSPQRPQKHVHFNKTKETSQKYISLKSHRMVKEEMYENNSSKYEKIHSKSEEEHSDMSPKSAPRSSHSSSSDSNLNRSPTRKPVKSNGGYSSKSYGTIKILRRGCEDTSSMEQTKCDIQNIDKIKPNIDYGPAYVYEKFCNTRIEENKLSRKTIRIGDPIHQKERNIRYNDVYQNNAPNNGYIDPTRKMEISKEREKQKKQIRKRKRQNKVKGKILKSDMEIYQRQIETGQLWSMISRYKTESLRNVRLIEQIHKGTYRTMYKARYQNKKIVLTVYDDEYTDDIKLMDIAHMSNSYFVQGLNDYMVGPNRRQWTMSMFHPLGDLQMLLSRDTKRHVIGEVHSQFITAGTLLGVDFLHNNGIVHGNIKPSKIIINNLGFPVITGFVKSEADSNREDMNPFTPAYAAQERRNSREPSIDIFSVGIVAYEIITSKVPSVGFRSDRNAVDELVYDPELFSYAGEMFIHHCLQYDPDERFVIGEDRKNLLSEEWFSTLEWRNIRRQTMKSPVFAAMQLIDNHATLTWEEKSIKYFWGVVMDSLCPNKATMEQEDLDVII
ncbi:hypothetical protein ACF0H5_008329 [Mactra antiquata]